MSAAKAPKRPAQKRPPIKKPPQDPGEKLETKTVREWAQLVKDREDSRLRANRADDRVLAYQEENGKLHLELLRRRLGSLCFGIAIGLSLAVLIYSLYV